MPQAICQVWREVVGCRNWPVMGVPLFIGLRGNAVYKNNIECSFLSRNDGQALKVKVNDLYFQYQLRESQDAYLVQIWWF